MNGALLIGLGLLMLAWNKRSKTVQDLTDDDLPLNESNYIDANTHNEPEIPGVKVHPILVAAKHSNGGGLGWGVRGRSGIWLENTSDQNIYIFRIAIDATLNKQPMSNTPKGCYVTYYGWEPLMIPRQTGKVIFTPGATQIHYMPLHNFLTSRTDPTIDDDTLQMTLEAANKMPFTEKIREQYKKHADRTSDFARSNIRIFWGYNKSDWKESSKEDRRYKIAYYPNIPTIIYGE